MKKLFDVSLIIVCIAAFGLSLAACGGSPVDPAPEVIESPVPEPTPEITETPGPEPESTPEAVEAPESTPEPTPEAVEASEAIETSAVETASAAPGELSDDVYSFMFSLNGIIYTLPFPYAEMEANGWVGDDLSEITLNPNQFSLAEPLRNRSQTILVSFVNTTANVLSFSESYIGRISIDEFYARNGVELIFPGNITVGSTYEEVIAAYGEPSDVSQGGAIRSLRYTVNARAQMTLSINIETDLVTRIVMENFIAREPLPAFEGDLPAAVLAYDAPTQLEGNDWTSFTVRFDGDLYRLPAPVAAFVANGWVIESDPNMMIPGQTSRTGAVLRKGNQTMRTMVQNYDDNEQPVSHTFVTRIEFSHHGAVLPIELPGGITENSTIEEIIAVYGEPLRTSESDRFRTYEFGFGSTFENVVFTVQIETGEMHRIELTNAPRRLN